MGVWLDDEFPEHPKVEALDDDLARWLYVAGLCYANRNLTGGRIPKGAALRLTDKASKRLIDKLLAAQCVEALRRVGVVRVREAVA